MKTPKRSPLALAVLAMLHEEPMHPYRMQYLIKERGKDEVINVTQRASLYQTIQRLERDGLLSARNTIRDDKRPERTVNEITQAGREIALVWMREILSTPAREYPEFPAAVSLLPLLSPEDVLRQFELRAAAVELDVLRIDEGLKDAGHIPRLFLLEYEYLRATQTAELAWVKSVIDDLRAGRLAWDEDWLRKIAVELSSEAVAESGVSMANNSDPVADNKIDPPVMVS